MPQYKVLEKSFVNDAIREPGDIVEYDGEPGPNLEPLKKPRKEKDPTPEIETIETV